MQDVQLFADAQQSGNVLALLDVLTKHCSGSDRVDVSTGCAMARFGGVIDSKRQAVVDDVGRGFHDSISWWFQVALFALPLTQV